MGIIFRSDPSPQFPPTEEAVLAWPSLPTPSGTLSTCVAHVAKARSVLGMDAFRWWARQELEITRATQARRSRKGRKHRLFCEKDWMAT